MKRKPNPLRMAKKRIVELEARVRLLNEQLSEAGNKVSKYKNFALDMTNTLAECANTNKTPDLNYWIKRTKDLWC